MVEFEEQLRAGRQPELPRKMLDAFKGGGDGCFMSAGLTGREFRRRIQRQRRINNRKAASGFCN